LIQTKPIPYCGRYTHALASTILRLGNSHFLSIDEAGRLLVSDAGDAEHLPSARVFDSQGQPLFEFWRAGSGTGQFAAPTGVAWWGPPCTYGGPYETDGHTLLLLHFNGDTTGDQGEVGTESGISFEPGRFGQGVLIDAVDTLTYTTEGNLNLNAGAIEFWVRPNFDSSDAGIHTLFETEDPWHTGGIQIATGGGTVGVVIWTEGETVTGVHAGINWRAWEWHHVAVAWQQHQMWLFVDGRQADRNDEIVLPAMLGPAFRVGSTPNLGWQADAVIDELRISDIPRVGNSETCSRILVADGGNHRVQAFDSLGNFITEFGSLGNGVGQFDTPQGLAVDRDGRVIVVDQGNDRLQVLSFDGQTFGYLTSFSAGFNAPSGVTVDASGHIGVADTGNNRIVVLGPTGNIMGVFVAPNDGHVGTFNAPRGVAMDADGGLVVADTGNRRVVTVHVAVPRCRIWFPLAMRDGGHSKRSFDG
jgi:DNA-binding beta-propeller fold protein YncE